MINISTTKVYGFEAAIRGIGSTVMALLGTYVDPTTGGLKD